MMDVNRPLDSTDSTIDCSNDGCEPPPHIPTSEYFFHAGVNCQGQPDCGEARELRQWQHISYGEDDSGSSDISGR